MTRATLDSSLKNALQIGAPVKLVDPTTDEKFYVLSSDQYHALAATLCEDIDPREAYPMIDRIMAEDDANDPLLESYNRPVRGESA